MLWHRHKGPQGTQGPDNKREMGGFVEVLRDQIHLYCMGRNFFQLCSCRIINVNLSTNLPTEILSVDGTVAELIAYKELHIYLIFIE